jgi:hypothetical protein
MVFMAVNAKFALHIIHNLLMKAVVLHIRILSLKGLSREIEFKKF